MTLSIDKITDKSIAAANIVFLLSKQIGVLQHRSIDLYYLSCDCFAIDIFANSMFKNPNERKRQVEGILIPAQFNGMKDQRGMYQSIYRSKIIPLVQ